MTTQTFIEADVQVKGKKIILSKARIMKWEKLLFYSFTDSALENIP